MDYKKIFKSRDMRERILRSLDFVPDKQMIQLQYRIKTGRRLNLKKPQRFTEKLQWYKLYYKDPLMKKCVDKYEVRNYVKNCDLEEILIPDFGVYNSPEEIDWDKLPKKFVIKDTLGSGGNSVIVCDKETCDKNHIFMIMNKWISISKEKKNSGREWVYEKGNHRILIEKFLESNPDDGGLIDYKFFCFNGKVEYLYVIADRSLGKKCGIGIFNANFEKLNVQRNDELPLMREVPKPLNYVKMIEIAERLSKSFPEARIDLYNNKGKIYFGEITFFDGSGYMTYSPDEFDYKIGSKFILPQKTIRI